MGLNRLTKSAKMLAKRQFLSKTFQSTVTAVA